MSVDTNGIKKPKMIFGFINSLKYLCFGTGGGPSGNMAFKLPFLLYSSFMSFRNCSFQIDQPW
jgi:hypothetical protein